MRGANDEIFMALILSLKCTFCHKGRLALKLLEKIGATHRSSIICMVYQLVLWAKEPFQSIVDAHRLGEKAGRQAGDFLYATLNCGLSISTSYVAGQSLDIVRDNNQDHSKGKIACMGLLT